MVDPAKGAKHPETCEKHGGAHKTMRGVRNLQNKKWNVLLTHHFS